MAFYKKIAAHTFYQIIARIASSGASFLITILVARHFGVRAYGDYAKVTAFVAMFYLLADFGLNAVFLQKEQASLRFRDLFYSRSLLAIMLIVLVNLIASILPYSAPSGIGFSPYVRGAIALFSITIFTEAVLYSAVVVFQRRYLYERLMIATILGSVVTVSLVGVVVLLQYPFFWIFIAFVVGALLEAGISLLFTEEKLFPLTVHSVFIKNLFRETLPVASMLIFNLIYFRIDTILLSLFRPSVDVGIYDVSYRVFDFLIALPLFLSNVLYPKLIDEEKNKRNAKPKLMAYVFVFGVIGGLVALPFWFLSPLLFSLIREQLLPAVIPLRILLLSLPVFFATSILQWILLSKKQQTYLAFVYGLLTVGNILANLFLIPQFGYVASAIITGLGEALVLVLLVWRMSELD